MGGFFPAHHLLNTPSTPASLRSVTPNRDNVVPDIQARIAARTAAAGAVSKYLQTHYGRALMGVIPPSTSARYMSHL